MNARIKIVLGATLALGLVTTKPVYAETGGGDSIQCGSAPGNWNAPKGATVASRTPSGVVATILGYLGEYYSHIMISHGSTIATHASMQTPRAYVYNSTGDQWVLEDIQRAGPGPATINMGATYTYLYGQNEGAPETVDYVDGGSAGQATADYLLALPSCDTITDGSCRAAISDPQGTRDIVGFRVAGVTYRHSYGVYTFVQDYNVHNGDHLSSPYAAVQCSSFLAMALNKAGAGTIAPHFYSNTVVAPAAQGLYDIIFNFAQSAGANQTTSANLADQLANCFIDPAQCESQSSTPWQNFVASGTANATSPDRLRGLGVHTDAATPWSGATQAVQWNQAGTTYGCWSEEWRTWLEPQTWPDGVGNGGSGGGGSCTPVCTGDQCGQDDGCGSTCPSTDLSSCGACGNAACGSCPGIMAANIGSSTELRYTLDGTDLTALLSGGTGDADLYVKLGSAPTTNSYDCRSWTTGNNESCTVTGTGTFHILISAYSAFGAATLNADVATCSSGGGTCTPTCSGDMCGQADGCGGVCSSADASTCGLCGNAACGGGGGTCTPVAQSNLSGSSGTEDVYTIDGTDIAATLAGGTGDADLYVRLGSAPTTTTYDCRSNGGTNNEACNVTGTGTWYVMVRGYSTFSGASLDASVASCGGTGGGGGGTGGTCPSMAYSVSNTSSASASNGNTAAYTVTLTAGTAYTFSTCASNPGDTYLRLYSGASQVGSNDDGCASGYGSSLTYTASTSGDFVIYGGCYNNTSCSGTIDISPTVSCP